MIPAVVSTALPKVSPPDLRPFSSADCSTRYQVYAYVARCITAPAVLLYHDTAANTAVLLLPAAAAVRLGEQYIHILRTGREIKKRATRVDCSYPVTLRELLTSTRNGKTAATRINCWGKKTFTSSKTGHD